LNDIGGHYGDSLIRRLYGRALGHQGITLGTRVVRGLLLEELSDNELIVSPWCWPTHCDTRVRLGGQT